MAKVWRCYEGNLTIGAPLKEITLQQCVAIFGIRSSDYECDLEDFKTFGGPATFSGYQRVIIEVSAEEATAYGERRWKPGIYNVRLSLADVHEKLQQW